MAKLNHITLHLLEQDGFQALMAVTAEGVTSKSGELSITLGLELVVAVDENWNTLMVE